MLITLTISWKNLELEVEDDEDELSQQTQGNSKAKKSSKPSDFLELFGGKRDEEDHFMFGIKFTR